MKKAGVAEKGRELEEQQPTIVQPAVPAQTVAAPVQPPVVEPEQVHVAEKGRELDATQQPAVVQPVVAAPAVTAEPPAASQEAGRAYLANWAGGEKPWDVARRLNIPLQQAAKDYWDWGKDTGNPTDYLWSEIKDRDMTKTPAQIEDDEKKQQRREKWATLGNFLKHLGNFIGTTTVGGPGLKLEDPVAFSERQRRLKEHTIALNNAYNKDRFADWWKERSEARRDTTERTKAENQKRILDRQDAELALKEKKLDWDIKNQQGKLDIAKEKLAIDKAYKEGRLSLDEKRLAIATLNAYTASYNAHKSVTTTQEKQTPNGTETVTTVRTPSAGGKKPAAEKKERVKVNY